MSDKGLEHKPPRKTDRPQAVRLKDKSISRRRAIVRIAGGAAVLAAAGFGAFKVTEQKQIEENPRQRQVGEQQPSAESRETLGRRKLNALLAVSLKDPNRRVLEKEYSQWAENQREVELGLRSVVDPNSRIALIEKRYNLRYPDNPLHKPLSPEEAGWADSENIYSETLAMCKEAKVYAQRIIGEMIRERGIAWFRPEIADRVKKGELDAQILDVLAENPKLMLLSEGGMARLVVTESGQGLPRPNSGFVNKALDKIRGVGQDWIQYGFAHIGTKPAIEMTVNTEGQPKITNDKAIEDLAKVISEDTGLNFIPQNIPGSEKDANSSTGGALGLQIMPARALAMHENLKKYTKSGDPLLHPLDPVGAMVMAYIFVAQGVQTKDGFQYGYIKPPLNVGNQDISGRINFDAIRSWNADAKQITQILNSDNNYRQKFKN